MDLYSENYRTGRKGGKKGKGREGKGRRERGKNIPCSQTGRTNIFKMSTLPKAIYMCDSIQFLSKYHKRPQIAKEC